MAVYKITYTYEAQPSRRFFTTCSTANAVEAAEFLKELVLGELPKRIPSGWCDVRVQLRKA